MIQALGTAVCIAWAGASSLLLFGVIKKFIGLRVSADEELTGISFDYVPSAAVAIGAEDAEALADLWGGEE